jgi:hypothetical protein
MNSNSLKSIFPFLSWSASSMSSSRYGTIAVSIVAQSPIAYTSPSGAPLTRRCASTSIARLCTWFGSSDDTRAVNGFIAIPVDHSTKFDGMSCVSTLPSAPFFEYETPSARTSATRAFVMRSTPSRLNLSCMTRQRLY